MSSPLPGPYLTNWEQVHEAGYSKLDGIARDMLSGESDGINLLRIIRHIISLSQPLCSFRFGSTDSIVSS